MSSTPSDPAQQLAAAALTRGAGDPAAPGRPYAPPALGAPPRPPLTVEQLRRRATLCLWLTALALLLAAAALLRPLLDDGVLRAESIEISAEDSPWRVRLEAGPNLAGLFVEGGPNPPVSLAATRGWGGTLRLTSSPADDPHALRMSWLTTDGLTRVSRPAPVP